MAFTSTIHPTNNNTVPAAKEPMANGAIASLVAAVMVSVYAGQKSRKQMRKLQRKFTWLAIKQKLKTAFTKPADVDRKTLTIILLAVLVLALVFISPVAALVLAILGLILILAGVI
jgi:Mg2+/citrate symporter